MAEYIAQAFAILIRVLIFALIGGAVTLGIYYLSALILGVGVPALVVTTLTMIFASIMEGNVT